VAKRRGNNEGSIFQLPDGRWCGFVHLGYENGKRKRKKIEGQTRAEVQNRVGKALAEVRQGITPTPELLTVAEYLEKWLEDCVKVKVRARTHESYADQIHRYVIPKLGKIRLGKLTPQDVRRCLNQMVHSGLSPRTAQYNRAILRVALNRAVKDGILFRNAAALADSPKARTHEIRPFNPDEARRFLCAVKGDRLQSLFTVAVALGMRQGEILGLRWEDVDFGEGIVRVRFNLQRIGGKPQFVEPKTARSRRTIRLPQVAIASLAAHRSRQEEERLLAGTRWQDWGLVFTSSIGTPLESCNVNHRFQALAKEAGLPKLRFHDLRHTAATLLLAQGVHPRLVMEILGHSQISLTMNTYSHVIPAMQEEVAAKMDAILNPMATVLATVAASEVIQ
jgi:integrase